MRGGGLEKSVAVFATWWVWTWGLCLLSLGGWGNVYGATPPIRWSNPWPMLFEDPAEGQESLVPPGENSALQAQVRQEAVRLVADFEPVEAIVIPAGLLSQQYPQLFSQLVGVLQDQTTVVGLVADAHQREKVEKPSPDQTQPSRKIHIVEIPHNTLWIRDYGPIFFRFPDVHPGAYDAEYPAQRRRWDDAVPERLAALFGMSIFPLPMVLEGGNLLSNGRGLAVTTTTAVLRHDGTSTSEASFRHLLCQYLGIETLVILEPLAGEPTGHVDMFMCFTSPETVLVGQYDPEEDPENAAILDRNAAALSRCTTSAGPLRVLRIPLPTHRDGVWRTYTNVVFANRLVVVPVYPSVDSAGSEKALELFRQAAPGWKVIGMDIGELIKAGGGLRCITLGIPVPTRPDVLGSAVGNRTRWPWLQDGLPTPLLLLAR